MPDFFYQEPFPLAKDTTRYYKVEGSEKFVSVVTLMVRMFSRSTPRR